MRIERAYISQETRLKDESIFSCGNGLLGVRGCFEEGVPQDEISIRGTYINGFCETEPINYNEKLYGFPEEKQTIVNLPDAQGIEIWVDDKKVCCWLDEVSDYHYLLDMEHGLVSRDFIYDTGKGKIKLSFKRFTSFVRANLFIIHCEISSIDFKGNITLCSSLNGNVKNFTSAGDPRVASGSGKMLKVNYAKNISNKDIKDNEMLQVVEAETIKSHSKINVIVLNDINSSLDDTKQFSFNYEKEDVLLTASKQIELHEGEVISLDKYCCYQQDNDDASQLIAAYKDGYTKLLNEQIEFVKEFWNTSRVLIDSDEINQEHLDLCLYVMLCSAGRDGKRSIAAKGLSGEGYEGHYFWDCETYIYPFFLATNPDIAKALLLYRYDKLDSAIKHARQMGHKSGALYPWRTITGSECSSYFPSGSAQYHINGDIARAFIQYFNATEDYSIISEICEVLLQTARLWIDVGHYYDGTFRIECVTGPDEYTCLVNNNYYTNAGAANNLNGAVRLINELKKTDKYQSFVQKTDFKEDELVAFKNAADNMYYPYDEQLGIIKQDDTFLQKAKIDLNTIPKENFPLLLHYHPLWLYRYQICKQADAVLADHLFCELDASTSMKTYKYYEEVTTHDSSLSKCIFGIVAAKLGDLNTAKDYFIQTLSTDMNDRKGNTRDGLHVANMGGCYRMVTAGFAGVKVDDNNLSLFPMLPEGIRSYSFKLTYKGILVSIYVDKDGTRLSTNSDSALAIKVYGEDIDISKDEIKVTRKCKGVIFDLDGVITDTAIYHYQAWKKVADELNIAFDEKKNENFKGVSRRTCLELLLEWGNKKVSKEEFDELLERKNNYYKVLLQNLTPDSILPGIVDSISTLHKNGIKVSLFSVSKNTDAILERLGIRDIFDEIVTGKDIVNSKPNFEGYLLAADRMKLDPRLCVMVEDSVSGINGAKALSMKTIAIMKQNKANADVCIDNTSKLDNIIDYL